MTKYDGENRRETSRRRMPMWPFLILVGIVIASAGTTYAIVNEPEPEPIPIPSDSLQLQAIIEQLSFLVQKAVQDPEIETVIIYRDSIIRDSIPVPYPVPSEPEIIHDSIPYLIRDTLYLDTLYLPAQIITIPTSTYKPSRGNLAWSIGGFILGSLTQSVLDNCSQSNGKPEKEYNKDRGGKKDGR